MGEEEADEVGADAAVRLDVHVLVVGVEHFQRTKKKGERLFWLGICL